MKRQDPETKRIQDTGKLLADLTKSDGWQTVRKYLLESITDLSSLMGIQTSDPVELVKEIGARQLATEIILGWLKRVESLAVQFENNQQPKIEEGDFILRLDNSSEETDLGDK